MRFSVALTTLAFVAGALPAQGGPLPTYTVITYANDYSVTYGDTVKISGTVSDGPKISGSEVKYYAKYDYASSYKYLGKSTVSASGHYAKKIKMTKGGTTAIKVVKAGLSGKAHAGYDKAYIDVYRWFLLSTLASNGAEFPEGNSKTADVKIKGNLFKDSLVFKDQHGEQFVLNGFCSKLMTSVGINDYAPAGTTGTVKGSGFIEGYGYTPEMVRFEDEPFPITFTFADRPDTLDIEGYMDDGKGSWVMGRPKIKCNVSSVTGIEESFD